MNDVDLAAVRDELTGLLNRRGFCLLAEQELRVASRQRRHDAVLTLDLTGLKSLNDKYGQIEGDVALREVASVLRATLRDSDIIARLGDDDFAVYAPGMHVNIEVGVIAARLWVELGSANASARAAGRAYQLETDIGVAALERGDDLNSLMARARTVLCEYKSDRADT